MATRLRIASGLPTFPGLAALAAGLCAQEPPVLVRGPYLQNLMAGAVEVVWVTSGIDGAGSVRIDDPAGRTATFAENDALTCEGLVAADPTAVCHRVRADGLAADTEYAYEVFVADRPLTAGRDFGFRTPPARGEGVVHLAVVGDSGAASGAQFLVAEVIAGLGPQGFLHTGDVDYLADPDRSVFGPYAELLPRMAFFPARGDHDYTYPFERYFFVPGEANGDERTYYSFDWGAAHIAVLDTTVPFGAGTAGDEELRFLEEDLAAARERGLEWLVVVMHEPVFTIGPHGIDAEVIPMRNLLAPVFDLHEVDLVLSGDDHIYHRSFPLRVRSERCPELLNRLCDEGAEVPLCYDLVDTAGEPRYVDPEGTIYVVTGGGGQILYGAPDFADNPCLHLDRGFSSVFVAQWHTVELRISPAMLEAEVWSLVGEHLDGFSISKLRVLRGDIDFSGGLDLGDAIATLNALFLGMRVPCLAAGNTDGERGVDITDAVYLLSFLFLGGPPPVAPYPDCGALPEPAVGFCARNGC
jgi:hypothetical protein